MFGKAKFSKPKLVHRYSGFTLVELSIVMIIIGLLIGGVLKGQELIQNSRLNAVITKVVAIKTAYNTFQDSYKGFPGDLAYAAGAIPNCNSASFCQGGNGDLKIGITVGAPWASHNTSMNINSENTQFWKHLALTDLLGGINGYASTTSSTEWGNSHPASELKGGFVVNTTTGSNYGYPALNGTVLRLTNGAGITGCNVTAGTTEQCVLTPLQAYKIDQKFDDGYAMSGNVGAVSSGTASGCGRSNTAGQNANGYNIKQNQYSCELMIKLP